MADWTTIVDWHSVLPIPSLVLAVIIVVVVVVVIFLNVLIGRPFRSFRRGPVANVVVRLVLAEVSYSAIAGRDGMLVSHDECSDTTSSGIDGIRCLFSLKHVDLGQAGLHQ